MPFEYLKNAGAIIATTGTSQRAKLFTLSWVAPGTTIERMDAGFEEQPLESEQLLAGRRHRSYGLPIVFGMMLACAVTTPAHAIELIERPRPMLRLNAMANPAAEEQRRREQRDAETRARALDEPDVRGDIPVGLSAAPLPGLESDLKAGLTSGSKADPNADPNADPKADPKADPEKASGERDFPALPTETPCLRIERFELAVPETMSAAARGAGASALPQDPFAFAAEWLARYNGQCVGQQAINALTASLTRVIIARGYLTTRVRIAEQDISGGVMKIALIPGTIHAVRFTDASMRASWRSAFAGRPGDLLKLADLEQALAQFEQVPGQTAAIAIAPAEEMGQSDVLITLTRSPPWRFHAVIDNSGSYATGRVLGTLGASLDNPLGLNDRLSAAVSHDLMFGQRERGSYGWSAFYAVPLGYWTTSLSGWGSHYYQRVAGRNKWFVSSGESQIVEWQLARNVLRSRTTTLGLEFRLGKRFGHSFIADFEFGSQRRNNTYVQAGVNNRHDFGAARLDATLSYRQGVPWLGARSDPAGSRTTWLYRMGLLDANLRVPFALGAHPFLYTSAFHGQTTGSRLFRVDDIAIGTRWSVRGFDGEEILSAERGFYWRNDLAMPLGGSRHAFYVGVDYGQLYGPNSTRLRGTRLTGAVLGVRGMAGAQGGASRAAAALSAPAYDLYAGTPVWKPEGFQTANLTVGFQLAYWY
jgi:hemolysin activation/secretion protein